MKQTQFDRLVIISAGLKDYGNTHNYSRKLMLRQCLQDLNMNFSNAIGAYKGHEEQGFVVLPRNEEELDVLKNLAFMNFSQEYILFRDYNGEVSMVYANGDTQDIGPIKQVNPKLIEQLESYTVMNGNVYTTEEL